MADCMEEDLSELHDHAVEIFERYCDDESRDVHETRRRLDFFLCGLRSTLNSRCSVRMHEDPVLTLHLTDLCDDDLRLMCDSNPDPNFLTNAGNYDDVDDHDTSQSQSLKDAYTSVRCGSSRHTTTLLERSNTAYEDAPMASTGMALNVSGDPLVSSQIATTVMVHEPLDCRDRNMVAPSPKKRQRTGRHRDLEVGEVSRAARPMRRCKAKRSVQHDVGMPLSEIRDLSTPLSSLQPGDALMLDLIHREIASKTTFDQFKGVLRCLHTNERIRLPRYSDGPSVLIRFIDQTQDNQSALCLMRSFSLLRLRRYHAKITQELTVNTSSSRLKSQERRCKSILSMTYDHLVREGSASSYSIELEKKSRKRVQNHVAASKAWAILCSDKGPGILPLLPRIAPSTFERVPEGKLRTFNQWLMRKDPSITLIARVLSEHLPAILEGDECNIANAITQDNIENWHHMLDIHTEFIPCRHAT